MKRRSMCRHRQVSAALVSVWLCSSHAAWAQQSQTGDPDVDAMVQNMSKLNKVMTQLGGMLGITGTSGGSASPGGSPGGLPGINGTLPGGTGGFSGGTAGFPLASPALPGALNGLSGMTAGFAAPNGLSGLTGGSGSSNGLSGASGGFGSPNGLSGLSGLLQGLPASAGTPGMPAGLPSGIGSFTGGAANGLPDMSGGSGSLPFAFSNPSAAADPSADMAPAEPPPLQVNNRPLNPDNIFEGMPGPPVNLQDTDDSPAPAASGNATPANAPNHLPLFNQSVFDHVPGPSQSAKSSSKTEPDAPVIDPNSPDMIWNGAQRMK